MPNLRKVETLYESNRRHTVETLRIIANEIEEGRYGSVNGVALVLLNDDDGVRHVFGLGEIDAMATSGLLVAGSHRINKHLAVDDFEVEAK